MQDHTEDCMYQANALGADAKRCALVALEATPEGPAPYLHGDMRRWLEAGCPKRETLT